MAKNEIKSVELDIEGTTVKLTVGGAKKLKSLLNELFGSDVIVRTEVHHHEREIAPYRPYYWSYPTWRYETVYCSGDATFLPQSGTLTCKI